MEQKLSVFVDPTTLDASITFEDSDSKILNEIRILLSAISDDWQYTSSGLIIAWSDFKKALVSISKILKRENVVLEFDEFALSLLDEFLYDKNSFNNNLPFIELSNTEINNILLNLGFLRKLTPEQERDVHRLLELKHGANFSVPGAGKTTSLLAVYSILKHLGKVEKLFVVSPINAFISWEDEINEIFKQSSPKIIRLTIELINNLYRLDEINPDIILINYEKMRRDINHFIPFFIKNKIHLVLDESHRIKSGINNQSFLQIIRLVDLAKRRDILSGTPMPQKYTDLEPQFDFLWGQRILPDLSLINDEQLKIKVINESISDRFVRTTKNELGLKEPKIIYSYIKMGPIQNELYRLFKSEAARIISGMDRYSKTYFRNIGRSVIRLIQAATNPMLLGTDNDYETDIYPIPIGSEIWELIGEFAKYEKAVKIEYLRNRIKEILDKNSQNKIVLWSYFVRNIKLLESLFKNYNPVSIYGNIPTGSDEDETKREGRIRKFHEDMSCRLMVANPQACGEGISLHKVCHYAIYLDRSFNAAHYLQSVDRIHRLGLDQSIDTQIEIIISKNTIDEILIRRLNDKIEAMGNVLNDTYLLTLAYDPADIFVSEEEEIDKKDIEEITKHVTEE
ncbi:MAG: DEAD/DEAH box helicase [Candidatus Pacebacteria bacterium]|nr:DEAD/DEAH box helicase [Candidatus Paceibacterota bacterium]MCK6623433.1 DEAD/DEAH box helicase [Calditrichia bacterium]NUQ44161.1 DEAD/DEAH box helicase [Calditrichaceae bacterium]